MMFGTSSERVTREIEQLELKLDELEAARAARDVAEAVSIASSSRPARRPLPEHLMREVHTHLPAEEFCPACGDQLRTLVSEVLGVHPRELQAGVPTDRSSSVG